MSAAVTRRVSLAALAALLAGRAGAAADNAARQPLDRVQTEAFRRWFVALVDLQVSRPSPRWVHRDCAGLVRFAVAESLRAHDASWRRAIGWDTRRADPPEVALRPDQAGWRQAWLRADGERGAFASALAIVQHNTRFVGRERTQALPGDLLFYDQGDDQHLMVWTGREVAYHTGAEPRADDNGLRRLRWEQLLARADTRWRPEPHNANFAGLFRLGFLA